MNPLMQNNAQTGNNLISNVKQTMQMLNMAKNPNLALTEASKSNPALRNVMKMCEGKNPKDVFYSECYRLGVNPDDLIGLLR